MRRGAEGDEISTPISHVKFSQFSWRRVRSVQFFLHRRIAEAFLRNGGCYLELGILFQPFRLMRTEL